MNDFDPADASAGYVLAWPLLLSVLLAAAGMSLLSTTGCSPSTGFRRNQRLRLIRSERSLGDGYARSFFYPVWSAKDGAVFHLCSHEYDGLWVGGSLWRVKPNGADAESLLAGPFCAIALARDGSRLVLCLGQRGGAGGWLIVRDLASGHMDSLITAKSDMIDVAVGKADPAYIYYSCASGGVYRIRFDGTGETLVDRRDLGYIDLTADDKIWSSGTRPKVCLRPDGHRIAYPEVIGEVGDQDVAVSLPDLTGSQDQQANPYELSLVSFPSWSPNGTAIVFTAQELLRGDPIVPSDAEIWVLSGVSQ